jgi:hypothetical protein
MDYIYEKKNITKRPFQFAQLDVTGEKKLHLAQENEDSMLQKRKIMKCKNRNTQHGGITRIRKILLHCRHMFMDHKLGKARESVYDK